MNIAEAVANYQAGSITDTDLIQFIAGKGAEKILSDSTINEVMRLDFTELQRVVGKKNATKLMAAFEFSRRATSPRCRDVQLNKPEDVYQYMRPRMAHLTIEEFRVLLLDAKHRLIREVTVAKGGLAACAISPRDVFAAAIREDAPSVVFLHNHPSGDPTPSRDDVAITKRLAEVARLLGITLIDHIVIADGGFASLAEMGKL